MRLKKFLKNPKFWFCPNHKNVFMIRSNTNGKNVIYCPKCRYKYA